MTRYDVLIVGGGHAGAQAAIALRQQKLAGAVAIVSSEPEGAVKLTVQPLADPHASPVPSLAALPFSTLQQLA